MNEENGLGNENDNNETFMVFPCDFPIKVIGNNTSTVRDDILEIVCRHFSTFNSDNIVVKESAKGNFLAFTLTVLAENQAMLDDFYREVSNHPEIKMVL